MSQPDTTEQILQSHSGLIHRVVMYCNNPGSVPDMDQVLHQAEQNDWQQLVTAIRAKPSRRFCPAEQAWAGRSAISSNRKSCMVWLKLVAANNRAQKCRFSATVNCGFIASKCPA